MTGLNQGTEYVFEVRAIDSDPDDGGRIGPGSSVIGTPTTTETAPADMTNVKHTVTGVSGGSGGTVEFTWDDPGDESIHKYQYRYDATESNPGEGNWDQDWADIPGGDDNNKDMTSWGPVNIHGSGAVTHYELRAINTTPDPDLLGLATAITVQRSNTPAATTPPPSAPTNLAISVGSNSVTVSWDIPANDTDANTPIPDTTNWKWERLRTYNGVEELTWRRLSGTACSGDITRYCIQIIGISGTNSLKIRAVDDKGTSATADDVPGPDRETETVAVGTPDAITDLAVVPVADDPLTTEEKESEEQLSLTWTAPTNVTPNDHEYRYRKGVGEWSGWTGTGRAAAGHTVTSLESGTTYEFQVWAVAGTGDTALSTTPWWVPPPRDPHQARPPPQHGEFQVWAVAGTGDTALRGPHRHRGRERRHPPLDRPNGQRRELRT